MLLIALLFLTMYELTPRMAEAAPPPANLSALFVVGSTTLSAGDTAIKTRLEGLGFTISVKDAVSAVSADAADKGLVVISESVTSANVNTKFRDVAVPVVVLEAGLFDDMLMTGPTLATDYENQQNQTKVRIDDPSHQMAANLTGTVTISTTSSPFAWGLPGNGAIKVASLVGFPNRYALYGYDAGATMIGMSAPARRTGVFLPKSTITIIWAGFTKRDSRSRDAPTR